MSARKIKKMRRRLDKKLCKKLRAKGATEHEVETMLKFNKMLRNDLSQALKGKKINDPDTKNICHEAVHRNLMKLESDNLIAPDPEDIFNPVSINITIPVD